MRCTSWREIEHSEGLERPFVVCISPLVLHPLLALACMLTTVFPYAQTAGSRLQALPHTDGSRIAA